MLDPFKSGVKTRTRTGYLPDPNKFAGAMEERPLRTRITKTSSVPIKFILGKSILGLYWVGLALVFLSLGIRPSLAEVSPADLPAKIPESLVLLPVDINAVVVEKKSQQLFLYSSTNLGIRQRLRFPCSTGAAPD